MPHTRVALLAPGADVSTGTSTAPGGEAGRDPGKQVRGLQWVRLEYKSRERRAVTQAVWPLGRGPCLQRSDNIAVNS